MSDRSRVLKTEAVILRRVDYGEADLVLTLFTPHYGKLSAIAKGARKPLARAAGHLELFTVVDLVLAHGRDLYIVSQAEQQQAFLALENNLQLIGYASHFVELIDRFAVDEQENRAAYRLLVAGLGWLCEPEADLRLAARFYELKMLEAMGYAPALFVCAVSGETLDARDHYYSIHDGGVVSAARAGEGSNMVPLPLDVFKILRHFARNDWEHIRGLKLRPHQYQILERVLHGTLTYLLEQRLQSIAFLRRVANLHSDAE